MEGQRLEYWIPQQEYYPAPARGSYDYTPDAASVPSLSASPTSTTFEVPTPNAPSAHHYQQQQYFPNPASPFHGNVAYQPNLPVTPSEFGSADEITSPCFSPRRSSEMELSYTNFPHEHTAFQQVPVPTQQNYGQQATWSVNGVGVPAERTHTTSGRRRAQNRAAQRAFRERKEKHARDLESQLAMLSEKYSKLETSHVELTSAYEKLRRVIHLLTSDEQIESGSMSPLDEDALFREAYGNTSGEGFADMDSEGKAAALRRVIGSVVEAGQGGASGSGVLRGRDGERVRKLVEILNGELAASGSGGVASGSNEASTGGSGKGGIKCEV
ncbi:uncharacterized protein BKA78DRAFT_86419 [Phyllosticta capitalensis]|uniref:uncharacterized protein n=1 Tax=Phyllosticta capitalensis TaxID=121624 RepID=UPI0031302CC3